MSDIIGNGKMGMCCAQLVITGNSNPIPEIFTKMNKPNFPNLIFTPEFDGLITFDENTGIFVLQHQGMLLMSSTLNLHSQQASAEIRLIPEFNDGTGWITGAGKKVVLTAVTPSQIEWTGLKKLNKGSQIRFWFSTLSGNVIFETETLDPGGFDCTVPAAIFYLQWHREFEPLT